MLLSEEECYNITCEGSALSIQRVGAMCLILTKSIRHFADDAKLKFINAMTAVPQRFLTMQHKHSDDWLGAAQLGPPQVWRRSRCLLPQVTAAVFTS